MEKDDEQKYSIPPHCRKKAADGYVQSAHPVLLQGGEYVMFNL